jgi:hypothetical protein
MSLPKEEKYFTYEAGIDTVFEDDYDKQIPEAPHPPPKLLYQTPPSSPLPPPLLLLRSRKRRKKGTLKPIQLIQNFSQDRYFEAKHQTAVAADLNIKAYNG